MAGLAKRTEPDGSISNAASPVFAETIRQNASKPGSPACTASMAANYLPPFDPLDGIISRIATPSAVAGRRLSSTSVPGAGVSRMRVRPEERPPR